MLEAILILACLQVEPAPEPEVRKVAGGMKFTEGPIADGKGNIFFSDIPAGKIMKWDGKECTVWREKSGGANGLRFDKDGNLVVCESNSKRVTRIAMDDQKVTVLADSYDGKKFTGPNDLCLDAKGGIYFTDPCYGSKKSMEQDKEAVYYIPPDGGKVVRVVDDLVRPNGIEMGKDRLYIADHGGGKIYTYAVNEDGTLKDKTFFAQRACDGMKLDEKGNLYTTTQKMVKIFDPEGNSPGLIKVPEGTSNVCFDGSTLYITAQTSLYAVDLKVRGQ